MKPFAFSKVISTTRRLRATRGEKEGEEMKGEVGNRTASLAIVGPLHDIRFGVEVGKYTGGFDEYSARKDSIEDCEGGRGNGLVKDRKA